VCHWLSDGTTYILGSYHMNLIIYTVIIIFADDHTQSINGWLVRKPWNTLKNNNLPDDSMQDIQARHLTTSGIISNYSLNLRTSVPAIGIQYVNDRTPGHLIS
jgi:hypothetical protein